MLRIREIFRIWDIVPAARGTEMRNDIVSTVLNQATIGAGIARGDHGFGSAGARFVGQKLHLHGDSILGMIRQVLVTPLEDEEVILEVAVAAALPWPGHQLLQLAVIEWRDKP